MTIVPKARICLTRSKVLRCVAVRTRAVASAVLVLAWIGFLKGVSLGAEPPAELARSFHDAARTLRDRQDSRGFWLSSHTSEPRFTNAQPEFNLYMTAIIVDLLEPIAQEAELEDVVVRARSFLVQQIEETGLVRYHGATGEPRIPEWRCKVFTPDADDTALLWWVAPSPDPLRLDAALRTLAQYRNEDGLYRTWLAPSSDYQCVVAGEDPNPADIGLGMHVFLFLSRYQPAAARDLCEALRRTVGDERNWIYYRDAPIVPILREGDLAGHGCTLTVPPEREEGVGAGQELWVDLARRLGKVDQKETQSRSEAIELLIRFSTDDFASVERNPPLLFHGDFSAARRYYWSGEVGFALWLRLYVSAFDSKSPP